MAKESRRHRHGEQGGTRDASTPKLLSVSSKSSTWMCVTGEPCETESLMHGSAGGRRKSAPHGVTRRRPTLHPVQPVYVEDLAAQAVEAGSLSENSVADAAGPDTFSFEALLRLLASSLDVRRWFPHTPPRVGLALTGLVGLLMRDMALTRDEVVGLMAGLLTSGEPPTGTTRLSDWLAENGDGLGRRYVSELRRNFRG